MKTLLVIGLCVLWLSTTITYGQELSDDELYEKYGKGAIPTYWLIPVEPGTDTGNLAQILEGRVAGIDGEQFEVHGLFGLTDSELWGVRCKSDSRDLALFPGAFIRLLWDGRKCTRVTTLGFEEMITAKIYLESGRRQPNLRLE